LNISGVDFPAKAHGGLSTLGDSLSTGVSFAGEADWISWGILHKSPWVTG
jgi:hypothetical protein